MSPSRNEQTSKRVAAIAGRILRIAEGLPADGVKAFYFDKQGRQRVRNISRADLQALAASALTQSPTRPSQKGTTQKRRPVSKKKG